MVGERRCGSDDVCEFDLLFQSFTVVEPRFAHGHPQTHTFTIFGDIHSWPVCFAVVVMLVFFWVLTSKWLSVLW